jgi:hypothetical protein
LDRVPGRLPNTVSRLIQMAAALVGGSEKVMEHMKCSQADFLEYCDGRKEPTWTEFDRLIELIVREQHIMIAKNKALLAAYKAKRNE